LKLLTIPKINKEFGCYIIEIVDDHGCGVVEDDADALLLTDVRGDNDEEDDAEGVEAKKALNAESQHKDS